MNQNLSHKFIKGLPKAELHVHFEGIMDAETYFNICKRNQVTFPFPSIAEAKDAYKFIDLGNFLTLADGSVEALMTEEDFYEVTWNYILKAQKENVRHIELTWGPTLFTPRGISVETQVNGMTRAFDQANKEFDMTGGLILTFIKSHSTELNMSALKESEPIMHKISGVGMAGAENGNPPHLYVELYKAAKEMGYKLTGHVGEEGGTSEHVWEALNLLKLERIDHGIVIKNDPKLMKHISDENIHVTLCPCSNVCLNVYKSYKESPARLFYDNGLSFSLNSDDPPYFNHYVLDNYLAIAEVEEFKWKRAEWIKIAKYGFEGSWLSEEKKMKYLKEVEDFGVMMEKEMAAEVDL